MSGKTTLIVLVLIGAVSYGAYRWYMRPDAVALRAHEAFVEEQADAERTALADATIAVQARLRDASSSDFRNVRARRGVGGEMTVCGEVNSNNALGGKAGFEKFLVINRRAVFESEGATDFYQRWATVC